MTNTKATRTTTIALAATLGFAAVCWVVLASQMSGMNMGVTTPLGSFASFMSMWLVMIAAMMLPGIIPVVLKHARSDGHAVAVLQFSGAYLTVWAIVGIPVFALYQSRGTFIAGLITITAGIYEFTPFKRFCRRRCCQKMHSGFKCGLYCVGSCIGLMLVQVALGVMSLMWMAVIAFVVSAQKFLPLKRSLMYRWR